MILDEYYLDLLIIIIFTTNIKEELEKIKQLIEFEKIKEDFKNADLKEKIKIYTTTSGLTVDQFKELLGLYPLQHLDKLEKAM